MEFLGLNYQSKSFILLINVNMPTIVGKYANNCWHFNINEQDKFHAQLS